MFRFVQKIGKALGIMVEALMAVIDVVLLKLCYARVHHRLHHSLTVGLVVGQSVLFSTVLSCECINNKGVGQ